jgi:hypothetical protein
VRGRPARQRAPAAWLGYLRGGSGALLPRVLAHNRQDVVTLARLALHLGTRSRTGGFPTDRRVAAFRRATRQHLNINPDA